MTTLLNGLLGGIVVGLLAAIVTQLVDDNPSATTVALRELLGTRAATSRPVQLVAQVLYGGVAGVGLLALELYVLDALAVPPTIGEALGVAVPWGALLFGVLAVVWRSIAPASFDRSRLGELLAYHLVFGIGLGLWIRVTWIT